MKGGGEGRAATFSKSFSCIFAASITRTVFRFPCARTASGVIPNCSRNARVNASCEPYPASSATCRMSGAPSTKARAASVNRRPRMYRIIGNPMVTANTRDM
jgi:hypothetical protein